MPSNVTVRAHPTGVGCPTSVALFSCSKLALISRSVPFPNKSPFRTLFRGVLPLSGQQISAEMRKGSPTFWHPGNLVGPQRPLGHCSDASRPTLHARPAGSGHAQTLPRWLLPDTDTRIGKDRTRPDLHERPVFIQYVTEPGDSFGQIKHLPEFAQVVRHGVPDLSNRGVNSR